MGVINPAEAIVEGVVVVPRMPPSHQRLQYNDASVIIQLFYTGLTLQRNTQKIWTKKNKYWTGEKIWTQWPATRVQI
jgi:hypothetical protein